MGIKIICSFLALGVPLPQLCVRMNVMHRDLLPNLLQMTPSEHGRTLRSYFRENKSF